MSRSISQKKYLTPEELFSQALEEGGSTPTEGALQLLTSGYRALKESEEKLLNKKELTAISSMLAYVAYNQKVSEDTVQEVILARYSVKKIEELQAHHFMDAVEYLVDLDMKKVMN